MRNHPSRVLIVADAVEKLKPASDTSIAIAEGALGAGHDVFWCQIADVSMVGTEVLIRNPLKTTSASNIGITTESSGTTLPLSAFTHAFVRKDPPFDEDYRDLCWLLASQTHTKIVNPAEALLVFHEKSLQWRAAAEGFLGTNNLIPTCVSTSLEVIAEFANNHSAFVTKPWLGHGGEDIHLFDNRETLLKHLKANPDLYQKSRLMVQPFLPEVRTEGDRRVFIVGGKVTGDFVRLPAPGKIESNLAQGGSAEVRPMTKTQRALMDKLADFLIQKKIVFAGADLIGDKVSEVNITSPTGLRTIEKLSGKSYVKDFYAALLVILLCFVNTACTSVPRGFSKTPKDATIRTIFSEWNEVCLKKNSGQFRADLSLASGPDLTLEGAWEDSFDALTLHIVTPLQEPLIKLGLTPKQQTTWISETVSPEGKQQFENLAELFASLGARNIRRLLCGTFALPPKGEKFWGLVRSEIETEYLVPGEIESAKNDVELLSKINLTTSGADKNFRIESKTNSFWGKYFGESGEHTLHWNGTVNIAAKRLVPNSFELRGQDSLVLLTFSDFD